MRPDGANQTRLTQTAMSEARPAWSPDSSWLAFVDGETRGITLLSLENGQQQLLSPVDGSVSRPDWSPDGMLILFERRVPTGQ